MDCGLFPGENEKERLKKTQIVGRCIFGLSSIVVAAYY